jgi:hypothetical protein
MAPAPARSTCHWFSAEADILKPSTLGLLIGYWLRFAADLDTPLARQQSRKRGPAPLTHAHMQEKANEPALPHDEPGKRRQAGGYLGKPVMSPANTLGDDMDTTQAQHPSALKR